MTKKLNRREFLLMTATGAAGVVLASCAAPTPQTITVVETKIVEKAGEKIQDGTR